MIKQVQFISRSEAEKRAGHYQHALVSMWDSYMGAPDLQDGWQSVLSLPVDYHKNPLNKDQIDQLVHFCDRMALVCNTVVVHCFKGESRSAAVAKWIAMRYQVASFDHNYQDYDSMLFKVLCSHYAVPQHCEPLSKN